MHARERACAGWCVRTFAPSVLVLVYVRLHAFMYVCAYVCMYVYVCVSVRVYVCVSVCVCVFARAVLRAFAHVRVCVHVCVYSLNACSASPTLRVGFSVDFRTPPYASWLLFC